MSEACKKYLGPGGSAFGVGDNENVVRSDFKVLVNVLCHFPECRWHQNISGTRNNQVLKHFKNHILIDLKLTLNLDALTL
jgi:hypothetical protein